MHVILENDERESSLVAALRAGDGDSKTNLNKIKNNFFSCEFDLNSKGRVFRFTKAHLNIIHFEEIEFYLFG